MGMRIVKAYRDWNGIAALGVFVKDDTAFLYVAPWRYSGKRKVPVIKKGIILARKKIGGHR